MGKDHITPGCRPGNRCRRWRECDACARIRQARIADRAEAVLRGHMQLQLIVIKPAEPTPRGMQAAIRAAIRNNGLTAGVWTVELGTEAATLHGNIIAPDAPIRPSSTYHAHAEPLREHVRAVAAYISKRSQVPPADCYTGKTWGSWGRLGDMLTTAAMPAIVQGAEIEQQLNGRTHRPGTRPDILTAPPSAPLTKDQYREIAARHMPTLAALADSFKRR